jgi:hypothetical protein
VFSQATALVTGGAHASAAGAALGRSMGRADAASSAAPTTCADGSSFADFGDQRAAFPPTTLLLIDSTNTQLEASK